MTPLRRWLRWLSLVVAVAGCRMHAAERISFEQAEGPPAAAVEPMTLPLGTITRFRVLAEHIGVAVTYDEASIVRADDPSVVRVLADRGQWVLIAAGEGGTNLHVEAGSTFDLPIQVVAP